MVTVGAEGTLERVGRLAELYGRHAPAALRLAYLLTGDAAAAEDLCHDAFVRVASRLFSIRDPEAFGAYLRRTIVNLAGMRARRRTIERRALARTAAERTDAGERDRGERDLETRDELWTALLGLPVRQRAALVLRYYEDLSELQTAEILRCPQGTVKSLVSRGLASLRRQIGQGE
jgi:RNA polymerase sigma-70 factor (sigma-E family)